MHFYVRCVTTLPVKLYAMGSNKGAAKVCNRHETINLRYAHDKSRTKMKTICVYSVEMRGNVHSTSDVYDYEPR